jgi:hypothetical protein
VTVPEYEIFKRVVRRTEGRYGTWEEMDDGTIRIARKWPSTVAQPLTRETVLAAVEKMRRTIVLPVQGPCFAVGGLHVVHPYVVDGYTRCVNCGSPVWAGPGNPPGTSTD